MKVVASPSKTCALVVGIEHYSRANWPGLNGPALDACRFVNWLRRREVNVPADRIALFLSPLPANKGVTPDDSEVRVRDATHEAIRKYITEELAALRDADLLFVFWGGHGLSDGEDQRYLMYGDSSPTSPDAFYVQSFLQAMRSDLYAGIRNQIVIVDACASFTEFAGLPAKLPKIEFSKGKKPQTPKGQFVLYASQLGQPAANLDRAQSGALSREVLQDLEERLMFPPAMEEITKRVSQRFKELDARGLLHQVPTSFATFDWDGNEAQPFRAGKTVGGESQAWLIPKLYDRDPHETKLGLLLNATLDGPLPVHFCLVYGTEFEQHASFVHRVVARRVRSAVTLRSEKWRGACKEVFAKPTEDLGTMDEVRAVFLDTVALSLDLHAPPATGWELLKKANLLQFAAVTFAHLIQVRQLPGAHADLIKWYIDDFWAPPADAATQYPKVVVFVMVELDDKLTRRRLDRPMSWFKNPRAAFAERLQRLANDRASRQVLPELEPLDLVHVKNWFLEYAKEPGGLEDADCRNAAIDLFNRADRRVGSKDIRRTDTIEKLLADKYRELIKTERIHDEH